MRPCPICEERSRTLLWSSPFKVPDGWPLPERINWYTCDNCGMLYGDGDFNQEMLNEYYTKYYGYGINSTFVEDRLVGIADEIVIEYPDGCRVVDFGGAGDDGLSVIVERLKSLSWEEVYCVNAGEEVPICDVLVASHVLEHIYDLNAAMEAITYSLAGDGLLIVDGPDATGLLQYWGMPMLDFHTKHINHLRMLDYLRLMDSWCFSLVDSLHYVDVRASQTAPCFRLKFKFLDMAWGSKERVTGNIKKMLYKLSDIKQPVNVWGLGDITWHLLAQCDSLEVLNYIDNDPAYRGQTYAGKPVLERPTNDAPIVIMAQGQREKLIANIRKAGITNAIIEI